MTMLKEMQEIDVEMRADASFEKCPRRDNVSRYEDDMEDVEDAISIIYIDR
jgi:hypothetical protein